MARLMLPENTDPGHRGLLNDVIRYRENAGHQPRHAEKPQIFSPSDRPGLWNLV